MLFNSFEFIFFFLPLCLVIFFQLAKYKGNEHAIAFLVFASLFFYGWWNPIYLILLIGSMLINYNLGIYLGKSPNKTLLTCGVIANLATIAYFKYAGFIVLNFNMLTGSQFHLETILLPLAISFFTFQQIAYLVDSYKGITKEYQFSHYALFVSFFPQLIAGPIVHHKDMLPQFSSRSHYQFNPEHFAIGVSIFAIGLFKKTVIADGIAVYANPVFATVDSGQSIDLLTAWAGALAYTFQLYFDFSGYSDMAIGLARMFGIVLPLNFYSPYKAANISEFWRRWHITLSHFLRDYVYIALGGNRKGSIQRYSNLMITMLLGGLWHGAGWNFVIWGALHGSYLVINHSWQALCLKWNLAITETKFYRFLAWGVTFLAVVIGWVFFRATTLDGALIMLNGMFGLSGISIPNAIMAKFSHLGVDLSALGITAAGGGSVFIQQWLWIICCFFIVLVLPNVQDIFYSVKTSLSKLNREEGNTFWPFKKYTDSLSWQASSRWASVAGVALALGILTLSQVSEFLYFQF